MFKITKKLAIVASTVTLSAGHFVAFASDDESQPMELESPTVHRLVLANTEAPAESSFAGILHKEFFPGLPKDLKTIIANRLLAQKMTSDYALVCQSWCQFFLGSDNLAAVRENILPAIKFGSHISPEPYLRLRLREQDERTLKNGTFRYQPYGSAAVDVKLSTMLNTNGDLLLPGELAILPLCVTWNPETFTNPVGDNLKKTLVLLLTLSELKSAAPVISTDDSFIQNVAQADLTQNAVCALIRYGGDDIAKWGFRCTILKYREMSGLSIWQIYTQEEASGVASVGWACGYVRLRISRGVVYFVLNQN